jgi:GDP-mannose 6-dehydrogenase
MQQNLEIRVAIFGLGYVGCVSAACLAEMGYGVVGIDCDEKKVADVVNGRPPFFEPGLEEIVKSNVAAGRLTASTDVAAVADADIALLCVGTPSAANGNISLDQLRRVVASIAETLPTRTKPLVIAVRSTVFPGTCEEVVAPFIKDHPLVTVVANPEFLREGTAVHDFMEPSLVVVGGHHRASVDLVASLYAPLPKTPSLVDLRTAEMIKYACNAFHATKIAFANEIGTLSSCMSIEPGQVLATLCEDTKLNASPAYLKPGFAFGGSCLAKDLRALTYGAKRLDLHTPLLESVLPSNNQHLDRAMQVLLDLPAKRLGFLGLAFKENTDDLRESRVVNLLEGLIGKGRSVRIFDPHIRIDKVYGSNKSFILREIPHIAQLMDNTMEETLQWADHLVISQKLSPEAKAKVEACGLPVIDLVSSSLAYLHSGAPAFA